MIYYENEDGRICILFPFFGKVLVGSTDIRVDDPGTVKCEEEERDYILQSLAFVLPGIVIAPTEIVFQFSGVRPLPASSDDFTGRIPRDHFCTTIENAGTPVLCMIGGKWTTFRSFGELAADMALDRLGRLRHVSTADRAIGGGRHFPADRDSWISALALRFGLQRSQADELFSRYGTDAEPVASFISQASDVVIPGADYSMREVLFLIRNEAVEHLDDLLLRRTTLAVSGALSLGILDAALELLAEEKGWATARRLNERARCLALLRERHGIDEQTLGARTHQPGDKAMAAG